MKISRLTEVKKVREAKNKVSTTLVIFFDNKGIRRMPSTGMLCHVALVRTDVS
jgi:hypothetical protein